jgi:putative transposase
MLLGGWFDWRSALTVVTPRTFIGWQRERFQLFWRNKSQAGRPRIPPDLQRPIRMMARDNPSWGEERIADELLVKLGLRVSPRTVRKYLPKFPIAPAGNPRRDQRWSTFLKNHAAAIIACDFFIVASATFRIFYVLVVMEHASRRSFTLTSFPIRLRLGPYNNSVRRFPQITRTGLSCMIATRSSQPDSMLR